MNSVILPVRYLLNETGRASINKTIERKNDVFPSQVVVMLLLLLPLHIRVNSIANWSFVGRGRHLRERLGYRKWGREFGQ